MKMVTTRSKPKAFAWSYSKLKNFETCPKKYFNVDVSKAFKEDESEQLLYGNALHKALADAISGKAPLPTPFAKMQEWVDKIAGVSPISVNSPQKIVVEQQLAITENFSATGWFDRDAWFRGIADVIKINGPVALVVDWKTGKIVEDSVQLALMAQCVFAHYPELQKLRTEFVWLREDATTRADFTRADMVTIWAGLLPRVTMLKNAHETMTFPSKSSGLCARWCPVTSCPHHGN